MSGQELLRGVWFTVVEVVSEVVFLSPLVYQRHELPTEVPDTSLFLFVLGPVYWTRCWKEVSLSETENSSLKSGK